MAKQAGPYDITGCYDNICFYKMEGNYYARSKSSLTRKQVKGDTRFKETMRFAGLLATASKIASKLYKELPKESKGVAIYRSLTGKVMQLLKEGKTTDEILCFLKKPKSTLATKCLNDKSSKPVIHSNTYADMVIAKVFAALPEEIAVKLMFMEKSPP